MSLNKKEEPALVVLEGPWGPCPTLPFDSSRMQTRETDQMNSLRKVWEVKLQEELQVPRDSEFRT